MPRNSYRHVVYFPFEVANAVVWLWVRVIDFYPSVKYICGSLIFNVTEQYGIRN